MSDFKNPFADPELTYKGKTVRQRGEELEAEERRQDLETRLEAKGKKKPTRQPPAPTSTPPLIVPAGNFRIENLLDRYRLHNISYNGLLYVVDWSKELLENGTKHSQDEWVQQTQGAG